MNDSRDTTRRERLKAALRDNLKRRKSQARGRSEPHPADGEANPGNDPDLSKSRDDRTD